MKNFKQLAASALFAVSVLGATSTFAAELVQNGGFEINSGVGNPNAANWSHTGTTATTGITDFPVFADVYALSVGNGSNVEYNQLITTTAGGFYTFSYAYNGDGGPNFFTSYFGTQVAQNNITVPDTSGGTISPVDGTGWFVFSQVFQATAGSTLIRFLINNTSEGSNFIGLDAVSVTDASAPVPEIDAVAGTAAITLLLGSMGLVSGRHRRRG